MCFFFRFRVHRFSVSFRFVRLSSFLASINFHWFFSAVLFLTVSLRETACASPGVCGTCKYFMVTDGIICCIEKFFLFFLVLPLNRWGWQWSTNETKECQDNRHNTMLECFIESSKCFLRQNASCFILFSVGVVVTKKINSIFACCFDNINVQNRPLKWFTSMFHCFSSCECENSIHFVTRNW